MLGLKVRPQFEEIVRSGLTYDFTDKIVIPSSAALNFKNSWYGSQYDDIPSMDIVDKGLETRHEGVLAEQREERVRMMQQFGEQMDRDREMFRRHLETSAQHPHYHSAAAADVAPEQGVDAEEDEDVPGQPGARRGPVRMEAQPKRAFKLTSIAPIMRRQQEREEARKKVQRQADLDEYRRREADPGGLISADDRPAPVAKNTRKKASPGAKKSAAKRKASRLIAKAKQALKGNQTLDDFDRDQQMTPPSPPQALDSLRRAQASSSAG